MIKESHKTIDISDGNRISDNNTVLNEKIELELNKLWMQNAGEKKWTKTEEGRKKQAKKVENQRLIWCRITDIWSTNPELICQGIPQLSIYTELPNIKQIPISP